MFTDSSNDQGLNPPCEKVHPGHPADTSSSNHSVFSAELSLPEVNLTSPQVMPLPFKPAPSTPQNPAPSTFSYLPPTTEKAGFLSTEHSTLPYCSQEPGPLSLGPCSSLTPGSQHHTPLLSAPRCPSSGLALTRLGLPGDRPAGGSHLRLPWLLALHSADEYAAWMQAPHLVQCAETPGHILQLSISLKVLSESNSHKYSKGPQLWYTHLCPGCKW